MRARFSLACFLPTLLVWAGCGAASATDPVPEVVPPIDLTECRSLAGLARWQTVTTAAGQSPEAGTLSTSDVSCTFDRNTVTADCTMTIKAGACTTTSTSKTTWGFVNELLIEARSPGRVLSHAVTSQSAVACDGAPPSEPTSSSQRYVYDRLQRLIRVESATSAAGTTVATYDDWEGKGRPIAGRFTSSTGPPMTLRLTYDDKLRTMEWQGTPEGGLPVTTTTTYDANGNVVAMQTVSSAGTTTSTIKIESTIPVCR